MVKIRLQIYYIIFHFPDYMNNIFNLNNHSENPPAYNTKIEAFVFHLRKHYFCRIDKIIKET